MGCHCHRKLTSVDRLCFDARPSIPWVHLTVLCEHASASVKEQVQEIAGFPLEPYCQLVGLRECRRKPTADSSIDGSLVRDAGASSECSLVCGERYLLCSMAGRANLSSSNGRTLVWHSSDDGERGKVC